MKPGTKVYVSNESEEAALKTKLPATFLWEDHNKKFIHAHTTNVIRPYLYAVPIPIDKEAERVKFKEWAFANDLMMEDQKTRFWAFEAWLAAKENEG